MPEDVPEDIAELLMKYKTGGKKALTGEQLGELFNFFSTVSDVKSLVMGEDFKFTISQYEALTKMMGRAGVTKKAITPPKPEKVVAAKKSGYFSDFAKALCDDAWGLGTETVMRWYQFAGELGYYDKEQKKVDMPKFVSDAIDFYITNSSKVKEIEYENIVLNSAIDDYLKPRFQELVDLLADIRVRVLMIEQLNQDVEGLSLLLSPIKNRLGLA